MKRKIIFPFLILLSIATIFLSSCILTHTNEAKRIPVYGNYRIAGSGAATHGSEQVILTEKIFPAIKSYGRKPNIDKNNAYIYGEYIGDNYFFTCKFFNEAVVEGKYDNFNTEYCFGVINLRNLKPQIFRTVVKLQSSPGNYDFTGVILDKVGNFIVFWVKDQLLDILNTETMENITVPVDGYTRCDSYKNCFILTAPDKYLAVLPTGEYSEIADDNELRCLVGEFNNDETKTVEYNGKEYVCELSDEEVVFTECQAENVISVTIEDLRKNSEEFRRVEEIFECELVFDNAIVQNGEIYISARYYHEGMFGMGMYSRASTVACFLYEPENMAFKYIGWLRANSRMQSVVKL